MAKQSPSEQFDKVVSALLGRPEPSVEGRGISPAVSAGASTGASALAEVARDLKNLPRADFKARLKADLERRASMPTAAGKAVNFMREGFHSITPYLIISGAAQWIDFVKQAFGAEEHFRVKRPGTEDVIMHAEVKIGDSTIELADANAQFPAMPATLLLRVSDPDAVYDQAVAAGATRFQPVTDHDYGSRGGTVKDASGNNWHIFNPTPGNAIFKAFGSVTPHLHPGRASELIDFLKKAFGAVEVYRAEMPGGAIPHAQVRIADSIIAMADSHGPYPATPSTLHLYVPDTDSAYEQALRAGAVSIQPPADQPYGERNAGVRDPFGNRWFIATPLRDVPPPGQAS